MKTTTVLMAAMLAAATAIAAGLTMIPSSVQDAQANLCSAEQNSANVGEGAGGDIEETIDSEIDINCDIENNGDLDMFIASFNAPSAQ
jgi:hypothetical protein